MSHSFEDWWDSNHNSLPKIHTAEYVFKDCWYEAFTQGRRFGFKDGFSTGYNARKLAEESIKDSE